MEEQGFETTEIDEASEAFGNANEEAQAESVAEAVEQEDPKLPVGVVRVTTGTKIADGSSPSVKYDIDLGIDLVDAAKRFGEDAVHECYVSGARVKAAAVVRTALRSGSSPDKIKAHMENVWSPNWSPTKTPIDPQAAARNLTDDELVAILAERGHNVEF